MLKYFLTVIVFTLIFSGCIKQSHLDQKTNSIIGDIAFFQKFGFNPDQNTDENIRIKTHLEYAENLLRSKKIEDLSAELIQKRTHLLNFLHQYINAGVFPQNFDYEEERKPCFIDKNGKICAVGYLVEQTAGRKVAEKINFNNKYLTIYEMEDVALDEWITSNGLTKEECAIIQPTYRYPISRTYAISSGIAGGLNLSMCIINSVQISKPANSYAIPVIGLISGGGQLTMGLLSLPKNNSYNINFPTSQGKQILSISNIGLGTATIFLSAFNLVNRNQKLKKMKIGFYNFMGNQNKICTGLSLCRHF